MSGSMTHLERIRATLRGEAVDRPPISMWRHSFANETSAERLAQGTLAFQKEFDWDFIKVNARATYHAEAWGMPIRHRETEHPEILKVMVNEPSDWRQFARLDLDQPVLAEHLRALEMIVEGAGPDTPVIMTVFNPISIAARMAPGGRLFAQHLREHFDEVEPALDAIADTFARFARACLDRGASGLFFATTAWAMRKRLTEDEYARFARPYDLRVLDGVANAPFNVLHVCQDDNMLGALSDYPAHAFNWDARGPGNPALIEGRELVGGRPVIGGISHLEPFVEATPSEVAHEVAALRAAMGAHGWMIGPGCTFEPATPMPNLRALRDAVDTGVEPHTRPPVGV